jgi:glycosyltransferase involved in cell wall biosynthesis
MNLSDGAITIAAQTDPVTRSVRAPAGAAGLRVLHVLPSLDPRTGGVAEAVLQLVKHMQPFGCVSEVATLDAPNGPVFDRVRGTVHRLGPGRGFYGLSTRMMRWLRVNTTRYDAIIVHGIWQFHSLATCYAVLGKRTPLFVYPHGMLDPWFQRTYPAKHIKKRVYWTLAERWVFRRASAVLFTCQTELELARESFLGRKLPMRVSGFGIEGVEREAEDDTRVFWDAYPDLRGKRVLLFLSRIHEKKGCDLLIDAFARIGKQHPEMRLVIAGPGDDALVQRLKRQVRHACIEAQVVWTGMLSGKLKWAALRAAELFVLPSHQENFGIAVVEALASRTPVLISNQVNIWKEIAMSGGGWRCSDTLESVADALQRWCAQTTADQREAMRKSAFECYQIHFRIEDAARRLMAILTEMSGRESTSCQESTL